MYDRCRGLVVIYVQYTHIHTYIYIYLVLCWYIVGIQLVFGNKYRVKNAVTTSNKRKLCTYTTIYLTPLMYIHTTITICLHSIRVYYCCIAELKVRCCLETEKKNAISLTINSFVCSRCKLLRHYRNIYIYMLSHWVSFSFHHLQINTDSNTDNMLMSTIQ